MVPVMGTQDIEFASLHVLLERIDAMLIRGGDEPNDSLLLALAARLPDLERTIGGHPLLDRLRRAPASGQPTSEFRRSRVAPYRTLRQSDPGIVIGPDVRASGLLADDADVRHEASLRGSTVRIALDQQVGQHLAGARRQWPDPADPVAVRWPHLWVHLMGLSASCAADRLGIGGTSTVAEARRDAAAGLDGGCPTLAASPPSIPHLFAGHATDATLAAPLVAATDGGKMSLVAELPRHPGPIVIALAAERTAGDGARSCARAFGHFAPIEAKALLDAVADDASGSSAEAGGAADGSAVEDLTVAVLKVLRSEREQIAACILQQIDRTTPARLTCSYEQRHRIEQQVLRLDELDALIPV